MGLSDENIGQQALHKNPQQRLKGDAGNAITGRKPMAKNTNLPVNNNGC